MPTLSDAIELAFQSHHGQVDKAGELYIRHCMRVMEKVSGFGDAGIVAVLHDILEDTMVTEGELERLGYSFVVRFAIVTLTRKKNETYVDFIKRVSMNPLSLHVKIADLEDNMDIRRLRFITTDDLSRLEKYRKAWEYLQERK